MKVSPVVYSYVFKCDKSDSSYVCGTLAYVHSVRIVEAHTPPGIRYEIHTDYLDNPKEINCVALQVNRLLELAVSRHQIIPSK